MHLLGRCLFGSLFQLCFFLLLSAPLSRYSWSVQWSLWVHVIFCTFWDIVVSSFVGAYHMPSCSQSRPWLDFSVLPCSLLGCVHRYYYYYYYYYYRESFLHKHTLMVFHMSLFDSNSNQVTRTLLSISADLNNAVVWIVSARPPSSISFSPFTNSLGIVLTHQLHILIFLLLLLLLLLLLFSPQTAGAVEYTDCVCAGVGEKLPQQMSWYDIKVSDGEAPVLGFWDV